MSVRILRFRYQSDQDERLRVLDLIPAREDDILSHRKPRNPMYTAGRVRDGPIATASSPEVELLTTNQTRPTEPLIFICELDESLPQRSLMLVQRHKILRPLRRRIYRAKIRRDPDSFMSAGIAPTAQSSASLKDGSAAPITTTYIRFTPAFTAARASLSCTSVWLPLIVTTSAS